MAQLALQIQEYWQECIECSVWFGVPQTFDKQRRQDKKNFYCPNGHSQAYMESDADRLRAQLDAKQKELEFEQNRVRIERQMRSDAETRLATEQAALKRQTRRVNAGVCPHCNRTFKQLAAHMKCKHAKEAAV